jgi:hypothetical protein
MIITAADFLDQFKKYALEKVKREDKDIKHTVAIGDNYEGLTSELMNRAIFEGLNLKMVERSFIYNDSGDMSDELDCILVVGEGQRMTFANRYKYHIKDVIAVFQVKKNLYADAIDDSHQNLRSVLGVAEPRNPEPYVGRLHRDAYRGLTSKELPSKDRRERFTDRENLMYHYLLMEAFFPLRIVIGYYGYSTEYGLREGFVKKLEQIAKDGPVKGYGPGSFPNLIICGENTIVKNNGMPMAIPLVEDDFYYHVLTSSPGRAMYHLLEMVWTRLSYKFELGSGIFGDDFETEATHPFISCKERKIDKESWAWEYMYWPLTRKQLSLPLNHIPWAPVEIDKDKYIILSILGQFEFVDIDNEEEIKKFVEENQIDIKVLIKELIDSRLVYQDESRVGLLTDELAMVFAPDGKLYAAENKSGEMNNFIHNQVLQNIKNNDT